MQGFRAQTRQWPVQPVALAASRLAHLPPGAAVADFGAGDARLAAALAGRARVTSLDLVAATPGVVACNFTNTPLSEEEKGRMQGVGRRCVGAAPRARPPRPHPPLGAIPHPQNHPLPPATASQDAAVFCLALMGTDYPRALREAARALRPGGLLWIAEVASRLAPAGGGVHDVRPLVAAVATLGFRPTASSTPSPLFVVLEFERTAAPPPARIDVARWPTLRPCIYKKR